MVNNIIDSIHRFLAASVNWFTYRFLLVHDHFSLKFCNLNKSFTVQLWEVGCCWLLQCLKCKELQMAVTSLRPKNRWNNTFPWKNLDAIENQFSWNGRKRCEQDPCPLSCPCLWTFAKKKKKSKNSNQKLKIQGYLITSLLFFDTFPTGRVR